MDAKARSEFLKKIAINGFSILESENQLTLSPRGSREPAEITIEEVEVNVWKVKSASGQYAGYARGKKRPLFESYINRWVTEALLQTGTLTLPFPEAPG